MKSLEFCNGVIVSLAFPVTKPGQKGQGNNNYADSDAKLRALLHRVPHSVATRPVSNESILSQLKLSACTRWTKERAVRWYKL